MNSFIKNTGYRFTLAMVTVLALLAAPATLNAKDKIFDLTILFTNDTNGRPLPFTYMEQPGQGGIAARATLVEELTGGNKKKSNTIILDTGGILMGRPESNLVEGATDAAGMSKMEYDASGVGIPELYNGYDAFNNFNEQCDFYLLNANVSETKSKDPITDSYLVLKVGGMKGVSVGIFSVVTDEGASLLSKKARKEFTFTDPIKAAQKTVLDLKKEKVDYIIALTYLGYYPDDRRAGSRTLAQSVDGIDLIIDGRTGIKLDEADEVNGTKIVQAGKWGLFLGDARVKFTNKKATGFTFTAHPVNYKENGELIGKALKEDPRVAKAIKQQLRTLDKLRSKEIATIDKGTIDTADIRTAENALGNLICDAMIDYTGADIAFQNSGGIGTDNLSPGVITRKSLDTLIKYDNSLYLVNLTGSDIRQVLSYSVKRQGYGSFLQVGGIRFTWSKNSYELSDITVGGNPLDDETIYKVVINSWMAQGGDGFTLLRDLEKKNNLNILHREVVYDYLAKLGKFEPMLDGRINTID
jgi:5'-nucleotidase/UDP-sugar diphosphatase